MVGKTDPSRKEIGQEVPSLLVAEDDPEMRSLLAGAFRRRGYHVTECVDGRELVSQLGTHILFSPPAGFDLVISDIVMPGATALEVLEAIQMCEGIPPVVLTTGFPSEETRAAAQQLGVAAIFEKPFDIDALVAKVECMLAHHSGEAA